MSIDLRSAVSVAGVMTQGRNSDCGCNQWVNRFSIDYSNDNVNWVSLGNFPGNTDQDSVIETIFAEPVTARYVRISVVSVSGHASMRWDALQLNPGGLTNDGRNWVPLPLGSSNAVTAARGLDISTAIRNTLSTNVTTALQASMNEITAIWEDAKTAQASAQTLYDEATSDLAIRRTLMEASAASSALADTACTNANNAMNAANGAHATASTLSQTHINTADREIAIIMSLKAKLTELESINLQTSDVQKEMRSGVVAIQDSLSASTLATLLVGLDESRVSPESTAILALLDQLLASMRQRKIDDAAQLPTTLAASTAATLDRNTKCGSSAASRIELASLTDSWNRATSTVRDRLIPLDAAKAVVGRVTTAYNLILAKFASATASISSLNLRFTSGQVVCTTSQ